MAITMRLEGADALIRQLGRSPRIVSEEERRAMTASLTLVEGDARRRVRQDTRRLMGSISSRQRQEGDTLVGEVGPSVQYGAVVEFGRKPHRRAPPKAALRGWARRHNIPERALFVIARKIGLEGIKARPFMAPAWASNARRVEALFAACGRRIVARLAGGGS